MLLLVSQLQLMNLSNMFLHLIFQVKLLNQRAARDGYHQTENHIDHRDLPAENTHQDDLDEEISLMIDLLNKHTTYLTTIKSGFYKINNIQEYDNSFDDLSLVRSSTKLVNGNYVD